MVDLVVRMFGSSVLSSSTYEFVRQSSLFSLERIRLSRVLLESCRRSSSVCRLRSSRASVMLARPFKLEINRTALFLDRLDLLYIFLLVWIPHR